MCFSNIVTVFVSGEEGLARVHLVVHRKQLYPLQLGEVVPSGCECHRGATQTERGAGPDREALRLVHSREEVRLPEWKGQNRLPWGLQVDYRVLSHPVVNQHTCSSQSSLILIGVMRCSAYL